MSETQTRTNIKQVGRMIITVADQDKAIDFYVGKLGFEKRADTPYGNGERWVEVAPPARRRRSRCVRQWLDRPPARIPGSR